MPSMKEIRAQEAAEKQAKTVYDGSDATHDVVINDDPPTELEVLRAEKARLEAELVEARKPRSGLGLQDVRILGSVQVMGDGHWYPVTVMRDSDIERENFINRCDDLTLAPRMTRLEPGVEAPALYPWPNVPDIDPEVAKFRGPTRDVESGGAW